MFCVKKYNKAKKRTQLAKQQNILKQLVRMFIKTPHRIFDLLILETKF